MTKLKVRDLVFNFSIYPRASINFGHVARLVQAIEAGASLPPIVVCKRTRRVVDGFHRGKAFTRVLGVDGQVDVVEKEYATDRALFLDAVRFNASHGCPLNDLDRKHVVKIAGELRISVADAAMALHVDPSVLDGLRVEQAPTSLSVIRRGGFQKTARRPAEYAACLIEFLEDESFGGPVDDALAVKLDRLRELLNSADLQLNGGAATVGRGTFRS